MTTPRVAVHDDDEAVARAVAIALVRILASPGPHHVVVTGGGVGTRVLSELAARNADVDWSSVHVWWGDERFLAPGDPERNETGARQALLDSIPIPPDHVHAMPADLGQGVAQAATAYADELARASDDGFVPDFDLVMLGMGPEGHVGSLFPGMPQLHAAGSTVAVMDSPKPPPTRISLTLAAMRSARRVWVVATGETKADAAAASVREGTSFEQWPAAGARGRDETVFWLDRASAALLEGQR